MSSRTHQRRVERSCKVASCHRVAVSLGHCNVHYQRLHRWGNIYGKKLNCALCGKSFYQKSGRQKTCTKACSERLRKATIAKFRSKHHSVKTAKPCSECGTLFMANTTQLTCSKKCREKRLVDYEAKRANARRKTPGPKQCAWCETEFVPKTHAVTCSNRCRSLYTKAKRGARGQSLKNRSCVVCGTNFKVGALNNRTLTCSAHCRAIRAGDNQKRTYQSNKGKRRGSVLRAQNLKSRFRITEEDYTKMLIEQSGKCAICGTTQPGTAGVFAIDHDHKTGKIRGLLCRSCNVGIGNLKDEPTLLRAAIQYLEEKG